MSSDLTHSGAGEVWRGLAGVYADLGPPLVPGEEDCRIVERAIAEWVACHPGERMNALLMGVTPPMAALPWPDHSFLTAMDRSQFMIRSVWPGNVGSRRAAVRADWQSLPVRNGSVDLVVADGSLSSVSYPDGYRAVCRAIVRALKPGGMVSLRVYIPPCAKENPADVVRELPRHATFHEFKLRLLMALQTSPAEGSQLDRAHRYWTGYAIDRATLAASTGWRRQEIDTIDHYRGVDEAYTFPALDDLAPLLEEYFTITSISVPTYSLGACCPTLVLRP
jgi:SAM-dependent methyltransferase